MVSEAPSYHETSRQRLTSPRDRRSSGLPPNQGSEHAVWGLLSASVRSTQLHPPPFADTVPPPSRLIIIPDMLKNAPMFKKVQTLRKQAAGGGKGKGKGKDAAKK